MKQENKKPLYKVLNEQRTQGWWKADGMQIESVGWNVATLNPYAPEISNFKANAQYTALAVNNLSNIAKALSCFVDGIDIIVEAKEEMDLKRWEVYLSIQQSETYKQAKEALNRIS